MTRAQLIRARRLGWRTVSLLPPDLRHQAQAALRAEGLDPNEPPAPTMPAADPSGPLRSAATVLECDAVLSSAPRPDWAALTAEHRLRPFGRAQRRALIARPDCPDTLTRALLTPWDSRVAGRLVARRGPVPHWTWRAALTRIGEVRPSFLRHALSEETAEEMILTTPRLDLLVQVVDGYDHNHDQVAQVFWDRVGELLRRRLDADRAAWQAAAAALPTRPGTFAGLIRRIGQGPIAATEDRVDLRVLAQAPGAVPADVIAGLSDARLTRMYERDLQPRRTREHLTAMILDRFVAAGVPPRALFARWTHSTHATAATRAWAHGLDPRLDRYNEHSAEDNVPLRRLLAARSSPQAVPVDPAGVSGALRASTGPVEAEAWLTSAFGENGSPPWSDLVRSHLDSPLPRHVLCALAAREGFPDALAQALPADRLGQLALSGPAAARAAVSALHRSHNAFGLLYRIRVARALDDEELLATARPAMDVLDYAFTLRPLPPRTSAGVAREDDAGLLDLYTRLVESAARSAPARFPAMLVRLVRLLPEFEGTIPELLASAAERPSGG